MRVNCLPNLLSTGPPGIGKTTVLERVVASLPPAVATGFLTRELRERGVRHGFAIETLDGHTAVLASVRSDTGPRVGRYRVRVAALDAVAVPTLAARPGVRLIVVDEIGKMESLSNRFADAVRTALDSPVPLLGTIARSGAHRRGPAAARRHARRGNAREPRRAAGEDRWNARLLTLLGAQACTSEGHSCHPATLGHRSAAAGRRERRARSGSPHAHRPGTP